LLPHGHFQNTALIAKLCYFTLSRASKDSHPKTPEANLYPQSWRSSQSGYTFPGNNLRGLHFPFPGLGVEEVEGTLSQVKISSDRELWRAIKESPAIEVQKSTELSDFPSHETNEISFA
jgi:hypothetical protein